MTRKTTPLLLLGVSCVALYATPVQAAECSESTETILDISTTAASLVPKVGSFASAGVSLANSLVCEGLEPLNVDDVVELIRAELEDQALVRVELGLRQVQDAMERLANDLSNLEGVEVGELSVAEGDEIDQRIEDLYGNLRLIEIDLFAPMTAVENQRLEAYDLSAVILLANYKLTLAQLSSSLSPEGRYVDFVEDVALEIVSDLDAYERESDRLRGMTVIASSNAFVAKAQMLRSGKEVKEVKYVFGFPAGAERQALNREMLQSKLEREAEQLHKILDAQGAHFDLIRARAQALLADPFVELADVVVTAPEESVMLKNAAPGANNRCLVNRKGRIGIGGVLQQGVTRMRVCNPVNGEQAWILRGNGQIRSSIADLCLTALPDKRVRPLDCAVDDPRQVWTRSGDKFQMAVDGETTCLTPANAGVNNTSDSARHIACDDENRQQEWLAFAVMRNGRPFQFPSAGGEGLSQAEVQSLAEAFDGDTEANLCLEDKGFSVRLEECDRFETAQLWAFDGAGRIVTFESATSSLVASSASEDTGVNLIFASATAPSLLFDRIPRFDGTSTFVRQDIGAAMFAAAAEPNASVFTDPDVIVADDGTDNFAFWQHPAGGKFAE